ncbi:hypothetical protein LZ31DRAFT_467857 [Colletotrichum somersetense]|nr:hypothetical protein LZ31DRAFT_467857 [Colletotrichum somersetense]
MKYQTVAFASSALLGVVSGAPQHLRRVAKREVPQEHSHELFVVTTREFLAKNNPQQISDPVFGLLGDAAAAKGAGQVTNLACLQQATADQAFTNAKATKDIRGMSAALVYQAIERNTGGVGVASAACTDKAVNPEIAALAKKHQDPASAGAAANNKAVTLELAKQLASIGGDPMLALMSGTFAPGDKADTTGKGNSCDNTDDPTGCIFTQKKLVLDATPDEITQAVQGITPTITGGTGELKAADVADISNFKNADANNADANNGDANNGNKKNDGSCKAKNSGAANGDANNSTATADAAAGAASGAAAAAGNNVQTFTGSLGGTPPPVIESSGDRPFSVNGDTFVGKAAALGRSCDIQHNACATAANSGKLSGGVGQCDTQNTQCRSQAGLTKRAAGNNVQTFTGSLGGTPPPAGLNKRHAATEFDSCSDPTIAFKGDLADRKGAQAFIANNQKDFAHGSALNIGVVADFICQRLQSTCKASAAAVTKCKQASTAAKAATQNAAAADTFNSKLVGKK